MARGLNFAIDDVCCMLPTFIVAGATKSGTTAIYEYLKTHPEVCMAWMKEPNFFTREIPVSRYNKGISWYETLFRDCEGAKAIGEVSPAYMPRKDAPTLIAQCLPDIQLIFVLRDPFDRIISHYKYALQRGIRLPDLEQMVKERHPVLQEAVYISSYHLHLQRYLEFFSREQISVFIYENMRTAPKLFMRNIYQEIGIDPDFQTPNLESRYNPSHQARIVWVQRVLDTLGRKIMVKNLSPWMYSSLRWFRNAIWQLNSRERQFFPERPVMDKEMTIELLKTIDYVERFLDRPLTEWRDKIKYF